MSLANDRIIYLLQAWSNGIISAEEEKELFDWLAQNPDDSRIHQHLQQLLGQHNDNDLTHAVNWDQLFADIQQKKILSQPASPAKLIPIRRGWLRYISAAAVIVIIFSLGYFWNSRNSDKAELIASVPVQPASTEIEPGTDKATLTLGNGRKLVLDSGNNLIQDDGLTIRNEDGELRYSTAETVSFNTVTTPNGGQYKLALADGTKVWLNSASSITFPTAFTGNIRRVSITGEAFFEVAKDKSKPFIVGTYRDSIQVFGTSFNVNSYTDEQSIKTTLVEGLVQVDGRILKPGNTYANGKMYAADIEQVTAWKNGNFNFNGLDLQEAVRQLGRWYDLEVEFAGKVPDIELRGEMGRDLKLSQVLNILSKMNLKNQVTGRKLIITE